MALAGLVRHVFLCEQLLQEWTPRDREYIGCTSLPMWAIRKAPKLTRGSGMTALADATLHAGGNAFRGSIVVVDVEVCQWPGDTA